jgi:hypothetical protein
VERIERAEVFGVAPPPLDRPNPDAERVAHLVGHDLLEVRVVEVGLVDRDDARRGRGEETGCRRPDHAGTRLRKHAAGAVQRVCLNRQDEVVNAPIVDEALPCPVQRGE